jgi:HSP20 family protein
LHFFPGSPELPAQARHEENDMTVMTSWDLFDDLRSAQDELVRQGRLAGHWAPSQFGQQRGAGSADQAWAPAVDITERKDAYQVTAELPGLGIEDLEITFQDGLLTIQGERQRTPDADEQKVYRAERRYGMFRRSITLPRHVQADKIEASAQDGVLMVLIPKAKEAHAKRIQVRAGQRKPAITGTAATNGA